MQIEQQIKRINNHVFMINATLRTIGHNALSPVRCPICHFKNLHIFINNSYIHITCANSKCLWSEYYMRIQKKEIILLGDKVL